MTAYVHIAYRHTCVYVYICMYVYIYVCQYACIHTFIYKYNVTIKLICSPKSHH